MDKSPTRPPPLTLKEAVAFGEYDQEYLSRFPEWSGLTDHIQLEYIRQAIKNRRRQLVTQWAEVNNVLDFRTKPELREVLADIEIKIKKLDKDTEEIYLRFARKEA